MKQQESIDEIMERVNKDGTFWQGLTVIYWAYFKPYKLYKLAQRLNDGKSWKYAWAEVENTKK